MTGPGESAVEGIRVTKKNLLFLGRVLVYVRLYGEQDRRGGVREDDQRQNNPKF